LEGPYRDLGAGFARLLGVEGLRRSPGRLRSVEDALFELLRNSRDAGARNVYVASSLSARRYRTLVVIDDGRGIPETHKHLVFEPGITSRHLDPTPEPLIQQQDSSQARASHGAGLSLYHIKNAALSAEVLSAYSPTAIKAVFDTRSLPEKRLQSNARPSKTNLLATLASFADISGPNPPRLYHASPACILSRLLENHIIHRRSEREDSGGGAGGGAVYVRRAAMDLGLEVSLRTVQRILAGNITAAGEVTSEVVVSTGRRISGGSSTAVGRDRAAGPILSVGTEDLAEIQAILRRAARSSYLEFAGLDIETRPGEVILRARVYEQEDEYE
jgi:Histidine kinase-, DNA gyrase B-, and HSP90-like ATPase